MYYIQHIYFFNKIYIKHIFSKLLKRTIAMHLKFYKFVLWTYNLVLHQVLLRNVCKIQGI